MKILKQSTAAVISFGPHLDKTDGNTLETGLVSALDHVSTGIKLSKAGGALTIRHATVTASTYDSYGNYLVTLDTTDTDTVGRLKIQYADNNTTALPVWDEYFVLPANVYDSLVGSDLLQVDVTQLLGTAWLAPAVAGTPDVNAKQVGGTAQAAGDLATLTTAVKTKTDYLPSATAGAAGGVLIAGSNAATTFATLTVSGATTLTGAVSLGSTLTVTGAITATNASNSIVGVALADIDGKTELQTRRSIMAFLTGRVSIVDNGDGTNTLTFLQRDDATTAFTATYNTTTGARAVKGSIT